MRRHITFCLSAAFAAIFAFTVPTNSASLKDKVMTIPNHDSELALRAYETGYNHYRNGNFELAEDSYIEALSMEPNLIKAHYWLGKLYKEQGRLNNANFHWEEVSRLTELIKERRIALSTEDNEYPAAPKIPKNQEVMKSARDAFERGLRLLDGGHWEGAVIEFKKAQKLYPANHKYLLQLARTLCDKQVIQEGVKYYRDLLSLRDVSFQDFKEGITVMLGANMDYLAAPLVRKQSGRFAKLKGFSEISDLFKPIKNNPVVSIAKIVQRMDGQVIISIGMEEGLKLSDEYSLALQAFKPGSELSEPETGKLLGRAPNIALAELLVTKVYKNTSWALIRKEYGSGVKAGDLIEFKKTIR